MHGDQRQPVALTIAGSDSSGGAGIQADLKTFTALGVYGASVITALTAQNTRGVQAVLAVDPTFVLAQLESVLGDLRVTAVKTGMLANGAIAATIATRLEAAADIAVVVDPVMVASSGDALLTDDAITVYRNRLLPRATLVTPNLAEAARLLGEAEAISVSDCIRQARALVARGCHAVLLKGGHALGDEVVDVLCDAGEIVEIKHPRISTRNTHGTGCTLSAAIAAGLARGIGLQPAIREAIDFLAAGLAAGASLTFGHGSGPVDHLYRIR